MSKDKHLNQVAISEDNIKGVIRYYDEETDKYIGHKYDNESSYWESKNPKIIKETIKINWED